MPVGSKSEAGNWLYLGGPWSPDQKLHKIEAQSIHTGLSLVQKVQRMTNRAFMSAYTKIRQNGYFRHFRPKLTIFPHIFNPNTLNYVKVPPILQWSKVVKSGIISINLTFLWFFITSSNFFSFGQMMLMVPGKRPSFDILLHKKYSFETRQNWKVDQVEIVPMGLPGLQSIILGWK